MMAAAMKTVSSCRLCRSSHQTKVFTLPSTPPANAFQELFPDARGLPKFPLEVLRCDACGHHQLSVVVDPELLFSNYVYESGTSKVFREHFARYAEAVRARVDDDPEALQPKVLEIGSNDGTFLAALRAQGLATLGVEPAARLSNKANNTGLKTLNRFFDVATAEQIKREFGLVDFWTANNVLAHIDNFVGTLQALHHCTAPNAKGVFEVQYLQSLLDGGMFDMVYHEHLDYWLLTELVEWLPQMTGWFVTDAEVVATHGGSLRVWVEKGCQAGSVLSQRSLDLMDDEAGQDWPEAWRMLHQRIEGQKLSLSSALDQLKPTRLVAYGAPAKLCTFVETMGIASRIAFVVDDSPAKQLLYAPGSGLKVDSPSLLTYGNYKPDAVLITAWNFAEPIIKKLREELKLTCPIIVPFPDVRVV